MAIELKVGQLVEHPTQPWGPGKILRIDSGNVKVHFRDDPDKRAYRTLSLKAVSLAPARVQTDPRLDNLPPFDGERFQVAAAPVSVEDALQRFLDEFPRGFADPSYIGTGRTGSAESGERAYKLLACDRYAELLGGDALGDLLERDEIAELTRRACAIVGTNLNLLHRNENMAFHDGLHADAAAARRFFTALRDFLAAPGVQRPAFEALAAALSNLPVEKGKSPVARWPVLTILPALADRDRFIFLKPDPTKECAERLRFDIQYAPALRWITYRKVLDMAAVLFEHLRPHGGRDLIDVQSFIWVIARY